MRNGASLKKKREEKERRKELSTMILRKDSELQGGNSRMGGIESDES